MDSKTRIKKLGKMLVKYEELRTTGLSASEAVDSVLSGPNRNRDTRSAFLTLAAITSDLAECEKWDE
jgi:hypothetical protein